MIPKQNKQVQSNLGDTFESKNFEVVVSDKTFAVLFDTLYQDKIQSVQRELYSNAVDSHVEAGCKDKPFKVTLPTTLEPTFKVRDFGVSLSHEDVMGLYSTVFATTKDKTNEQVGYLGLGSKVPFCYADAFTVKAFKNGEERTYLASLDNNRIPTITSISSNPTSEADGLEVSFPVKNHDVKEFKKKASLVSVALPVKPTFNVEVPVQVPKPIRTFDNGKIKMFDNHVSYYDDKAKLPILSIKQGWVIYPVPEGEDTSWIPYNTAVLIEVPIGTVDVAASRESLSMNDQTKAAVSKVSKDALNTIVKYVEGEVASSKNYYDACIKYFSQLKGLFNPNKGAVVRYQGKELKNIVDLPDISGKWRSNMNQKWPEMKLEYNTTRPRINVQYVPDTTFYYKLEGAKVQRMIMRLNEFGESRAVLMNDVTQADVDKVRTELGLDKSRFVNVETLDDVAVAPKVKGVAQGTTTRPYSGEGDWNRVDLPANMDYVWLPVAQKGGKITFKDKREHEYGYKYFYDRIIDELASLSKAVKDMGGTEFPQIGTKNYDRYYYRINNLYFMISSVEKKLDPPVDKRLDNVIAKYIMDNKTFIEDIYASEYLSQHGMRTVSAATFGFKEVSLRSWKFANLLNDYGVSIGKPAKAVEIEKTYPLLFNTVTERHMQEYIKTINHVRKLKAKEKANA